MIINRLKRGTNMTGEKKHEEREEKRKDKEGEEEH